MLDHTSEHTSKQVAVSMAKFRASVRIHDRTNLRTHIVTEVGPSVRTQFRALARFDVAAVQHMLEVHARHARRCVRTRVRLDGRWYFRTVATLDQNTYLMPEQMSEHCVSARVTAFVGIVCQYMCHAFFQIALQGGDRSKYSES